MTTRQIIIRIVDWSLVAGSFGLILIATVALRPPANVPAAPAAPPAVVATR